ncbi:HD domain-containing protein [Nocardia sp. CA-119907]|uniref:HD domain-containing protein n=1 Tax=Nocardia sp. CA-119907 TaxID=3239973 RepID=UPI003D9876B9
MAATALSALAATAGCDWDWAKRTGGILSSAQQERFARLYWRLQQRLIIEQDLNRIGVRGNVNLDFGSAEIPRTALTAAAEVAARSLTEPVLNHCLRGYYYARAMAECWGRPFDDEISYAACLLHDLYLETPTPGRCFAVVGALHAMDIALEAGVPSDRADALGRAIALHMNLDIAHLHSDPAGFVAAGAFVDVYGVPKNSFEDGWLQELWRRYPRLGFTQIAAASMEAQAAVENSRTHWLVNHGHVIHWVLKAPYND